LSEGSLIPSVIDPKCIGSRFACAKFADACFEC
jgi:hypothetical protein